MPKAKEDIKWNVKWTLEKYRGNLPTDEDRKLFKPYEVINGEGNLLLNEGIDELWDLVTGAGGTAYNNANARIGVGNGNAAAVATQTALQGGSTKLNAMEATYPLSTSQAVTFRSSFGDGEAEFAWEEWTIDNGASADKNLNRKVVSLGTKASGATWVFTVTVTLS
jgi:hypothetical protein